VTDVRRLIVLGSTGSIGTQTLDVVAHLNRLHEAGRCPVRHEVVGLAARSSTGLLAEQAALWPGARIALSGGRGEDARRVRASFAGADAPEALVRETPADLVMSAIVGSAGINATLAALERGTDVALANKESLVAGGPLVVDAALASGAQLRPVDSEHAAAWLAISTVMPGACPPFEAPPELKRLTLTASGGPFRLWSKDDIARATPGEALRHPTWRMGPKVTLDCASLMNKALEVIEAHFLFGLGSERLGVAVHPHSLAHAIAELIDGASVAQLAPADMRIPIQQSLTWPRRLPAQVEPLDPAEMTTLQFEPPDLERFPALRLAWEVIERGGTAGAIVNAANEAGVEAFLEQSGPRLAFPQIAELAAEALDSIGVSPLRDVADAFEADREGRRFVRSRLELAIE